MDLMDRRQFLLATGAASSSLLEAAPTPASAPATVLFGDKATALEKTRIQSGDLWVRAADLPKINEFELKPQGACRADICIPVAKNLKQGEFFNLTGFAKKIGETVVADSGVWSLGEVPLLRSSFYNSRVAPDFSVPDRKGRPVHLSDFKGKKVLIVTWASW